MKGSFELAQIALTEKNVDLASKGKLKKLAGADEQVTHSWPLCLSVCLSVSLSLCLSFSADHRWPSPRSGLSLSLSVSVSLSLYLLGSYLACVCWL